MFSPEALPTDRSPHPHPHPHLTATASASVTLVQCLCGNTAVMRWFVDKRGQVSALRIASNFVLLVFPALIRTTHERFGWRVTFRLLGAATLAVGGVAASLLRSSPEEMGLLPDGRLPPKGRTPSKPEQERRGDPAVVSPKTASSDPRDGDGDGGARSANRNDVESAAPPGSHSPPGTQKGPLPADHHLGEPDWTFDEVLRCRFLWAFVGCATCMDIFWS